MKNTIEAETEIVYSILSDAYDQSPWLRTQIMDDLKRPDSHYFYIHNQEGRPLAFAAVQKLSNEMELTQLAVRKAYRRQGLATRLLNLILEDCSESIFLEVRASNQAAQELYKKAGFDKVGIRKNYYHQPIEDAIVMKGRGKHEGQIHFGH